MSKKPDTAAALAGILKAKRGDDRPQLAVAEDTIPPPSPAPMAPPTYQPKVMIEPSTIKRRYGKSSDKANYSQFSVYLRRDTRKKVGRALDDADTGQDFSELVQELLDKWLTART